MRKILSVLIAVTLFSSGTAVAGPKNTVGWLSILGGTGLVIGAFNYSTGCSSGATTITTHNAGYTDTTCISSGYGYVDIKGPDTSAALARPTMLWVGLGAAATGVLLLLIPSGAQRYTPDLQVMPKGVAVTKTKSW